MAKKKKWTRNQKLLLWGIIVPAALFFLYPVRDDGYKYLKNKSYLAYYIRC